MRFAVFLSAVALLAAPAFAEHTGEKAQPAPGHEQQTYRFGATYNVTSARTASACQSSCAGDKKCQAWSYIQPLRSAPAYCELKRAAGEAEYNPASISGISPRIMNAFYGNALPEPADSQLLGGHASHESGVIITAATRKPKHSTKTAHRVRYKSKTSQTAKSAQAKPKAAVPAKAAETPPPVMAGPAFTKALRQPTISRIVNEPPVPNRPEGNGMRTRY